ncbi:LAME_0G02718g1_1 [Lachancea meyersii CBS 8951]|uniref:Restriction of telomere capping protein 4 n=1 Tax=Lachancea meyersii CBS 8951 TaxID=1266667 RepID=A0A1G4K686_9SACH|nr:LAME_0G02718g1_1 [Lachancea meyersii CBS 8951]
MARGKPHKPTVRHLSVQRDLDETRLTDYQKRLISTSPVNYSEPESDDGSGLVAGGKNGRIEIDLGALDDKKFDVLVSSVGSPKKGHEVYKPGKPHSSSGPSTIRMDEQDISEVDLQRKRNALERAFEEDSTDDRESSEQAFEDPVRKLRKKSPEASQKQKFEEILAVRLRYQKKFALPPVLFADELREKVRNHLPLLDSILKGKRVSRFLIKAQKVSESSSRAVLTVDELRRLDLNEFTAGYYGMRRQMLVAADIIKKYEKAMKKMRSGTLRWWGIRDFAQYVLAPELLCALCCEEMNLNITEAWNLMENTTEFGRIVADRDPLEPFEVEYEQRALRNLGLDERYSSMSYREESED